MINVTYHLGATSGEIACVALLGAICGYGLAWIVQKGKAR